MNKIDLIKVAASKVVQQKQIQDRIKEIHTGGKLTGFKMTREDPIKSIDSIVSIPDELQTEIQDFIILLLVKKEGDLAKEIEAINIF